MRTPKVHAQIKSLISDLESLPNRDELFQPERAPARHVLKRRFAGPEPGSMLRRANAHRHPTRERHQDALQGFENKEGQELRPAKDVKDNR